MKCIQCNTEFESKRSTAKYCSDKCRVESYRNKAPEGFVSVTDKYYHDNIKDLGPKELYFRINLYSQDTWKDSPEYSELTHRLNTIPLKALEAQGYYIPNHMYPKPSK